MDEYHDLYLKSDVLLLVDVFKSFRKTCLQYYKLDPCHYFTSPSLSCDSMLKMTNIKVDEYHDLYLKSDVLLLVDVFKSFRKTCLQYYKLDPCHYFTSPSLSCDSMLKMTNIKVELMTNVDMFQFIEKGMSGGVSYIAN